MATQSAPRSQMRVTLSIGAKENRLAESTGSGFIVVLPLSSWLGLRGVMFVTRFVAGAGERIGHDSCGVTNVKAGIASTPRSVPTQTKCRIAAERFRNRYAKTNPNPNTIEILI